MGEVNTDKTPQTFIVKGMIMLDRRRFMALSTSGILAGIARSATAATDPYARVAIAEQVIAAANGAGKPVPASVVLNALGSDLAPHEKRIAIFELVRRVPYKLTAWKGDPESLFSLGRGDCRHKAAAARHLLRKAGFEAEHRIVTFDWADLPVPRSMLSLLTDTRSFHDTVYVSVSGKWLLFDATWDPALARIGFPVLTSWDGISSTSAVTAGEVEIVRVGEIPKGSNMYEHFGIRWPNRERTLSFNRNFNAWSDRARA